MANSTTIIIKITKGLDGYGRAIKGHTAINRKKKKTEGEFLRKSIWLFIEKLRSTMIQSSKLKSDFGNVIYA
jgi:hypothetical protein